MEYTVSAGEGPNARPPETLLTADSLKTKSFDALHLRASKDNAFKRSAYAERQEYTRVNAQHM